MLRAPLKGLRLVDYRVRIADCELRIAAAEFQIADFCGLQREQRESERDQGKFAFASKPMKFTGK